jgi:type II secretory ATPase GspE/PulE/Tfp pilus assembly ATPase PilB-like protein/DNA-binding response OmpR family regulator
MTPQQRSHILSVDDDPVIQKIIEKFLTSSGYQVTCLHNAREALEEIRLRRPGLILLDVLMPEMNGYDFCVLLQKEREISNIPVIFLTGLAGEQDKAKAFSVGAVDYLLKPINKTDLLTKVKAHLSMNLRWKELFTGAGGIDEQMDPSKFNEFKESLVRKFRLPRQVGERLAALPPSQIYDLSPEMVITNRQVAKEISEFLHFPYLPQISRDDVQLGALPTGFCKIHSTVPIRGKQSKFAFVVSNPFDWELVDALKKFSQTGSPLEILITEIENIEPIFQGSAKENPPAAQGNNTIFGDTKKASRSQGLPGTREARGGSESSSIHALSHTLLETAATERASDIHIQPKEDQTIVRLRVDGDMEDLWTLEKEIGTRLISRFKALSGMDITERRKPQDSSAEAQILQRPFKLRLATASTPDGESLTIRILDPEKKLNNLQELGMSPTQIELMTRISKRTSGLVLLVGPTGSGKTTTLYSLLSQIDCQVRSLISVEDPVEYRIPFANQQQVNLRAGVTFEVLLKSLVRQDPDILFIGEVRDPYSAKIAMDFASTGHLTLSTLHTSNATTAIFRLERLDVGRGIMADSILAIVAQRLLKVLCPSCKRVEPISQEEIDLISPYTEDLPSHIAHPAGCQECKQTGYTGREGVYEVIHCDAGVAEMIRRGCPISEIRQFVRQRGDQLISQQAIEKVKKLSFSLKDVYEKVLIEENPSFLKPAAIPSSPVEESPIESAPLQFRILLVEDDGVTQKVITHFLESEGFQVVTADDGVDAIIKMGQSRFDLILSDINIPNLDGFKLLEMVQQKGFGIPIILMTGRMSQEDEVRGLELGAIDYLRKPIQKELLLLRVRRTLKNGSGRDIKRNGAGTLSPPMGS